MSSGYVYANETEGADWRDLYSVPFSKDTKPLGRALGLFTYPTLPVSMPAYYLLSKNVSNKGYLLEKYNGQIRLFNASHDDISEPSL